MNSFLQIPVHRDPETRQNPSQATGISKVHGAPIFSSESSQVLAPTVPYHHPAL